MGKKRFEKVAKGNKKINKVKVEEWLKGCEVIALSFIANEKINRLIGPHMVALGNTKEAMGFVKILAMLVSMDRGLREKCLREVLDDEADFLRMYSEAIEDIIKKASLPSPLPHRERV